MLITRLDAIHPAGDGVLCVFFAVERLATTHVYASRLRDCGWEVDVYREDVGPLSDQQWRFLHDGYWPLVPTCTLLEWFPKYSAPTVDGDEVFVPKGGPACPP